jgi:hypothetical protein
MKQFFHTSGTRFKVGDVFGGPGKNVFLSTREVPHSTILEAVEGGFSCWKEFSAARSKETEKFWDERMAWNENPVGEKPEYPKTVKIKPDKIWVYEVRPFKNPIWRNMNEEYVAHGVFVEVVRIVGNAKGILSNAKRRFGNGVYTSKVYHFSKAIRYKQ